MFKYRPVIAVLVGYSLLWLPLLVFADSNAIRICTNNVPQGMQVVKVDLATALPTVIAKQKANSTVQDLFTNNNTSYDQSQSLLVINANYFVNYDTKSPTSYPNGTPIGRIYINRVLQQYLQNNGQISSGNYPYPQHINKDKTTTLVPAQTLAFYYDQSAQNPGALHAAIVSNRYSKWSNWITGKTVLDAVSGIQIRKNNSDTLVNAIAARIQANKNRQRMAVGINAANDQILYVVSVDRTYKNNSGGITVERLLKQVKKSPTTYCNEPDGTTVSNVINLDGGSSATLFAIDKNKTAINSAAPYSDGSFRQVPAMLAFSGPFNIDNNLLQRDSTNVYIKNMGVSQSSPKAWLNAVLSSSGFATVALGSFHELSSSWQILFGPYDTTLSLANWGAFFSTNGMALTTDASNNIIFGANLNYCNVPMGLFYNHCWTLTGSSGTYEIQNAKVSHTQQTPYWLYGAASNILQLNTSDCSSSNPGSCWVMYAPFIKQKNGSWPPPQAYK